MDFELPIYPENQAAMKKYMQSQFEFNGVKAPDHHLIERELWQSVKQLPPAEIM
ncbi:DNA alkylation repair protein [Latilactobacillus curvatus]|nr:DNA alkylation repair protein [Latilactobacillus curvatus]MDT7015719.1 DNA alkylation repair protein [Latilactobacillus curvatus]